MFIFKGTTETTTPTTTVPTTTVPEPFTCPDANTGFYPVSPGACSGDYFTCFEGIAYPEVTGPLFLFLGRSNLYAFSLDTVYLFDVLSFLILWQKCPDGNIFDVTIHSCTAPENAACNRNT